MLHYGYSAVLGCSLSETNAAQKLIKSFAGQDYSCTVSSTCSFTYAGYGVTGTDKAGLVDRGLGVLKVCKEKQSCQTVQLYHEHMYPGPWSTQRDALYLYVFHLASDPKKVLLVVEGGTCGFSDGDPDLSMVWAPLL